MKEVSGLISLRIRNQDNRYNSKIFKLCRRAASYGDAEAQFTLGWCYESGIGTKPDINKAAKWYHAASDQGHVVAAHHLYHLY